MTVSALNTCNCPLLQVPFGDPSRQRCIKIILGIVRKWIWAFLPLKTITSKIISSNKLKLNDQELNLSFVANLTDAAIHKLLSAPRDSRPGALWSFVYLLLRSFCICCWDLLWICCWDLLWICSYLFVCVFWVRLWSSIRVDYLCFVVCFFSVWWYSQFLD